MILPASGLIESALALRTGHFISDLANYSSFLFHSMRDLNWCGFYLWNEKTQSLIVGPFQGKPACVEIPKGKGVCGAAYSARRSFLVPDVHQFPGHIACDENSKSELVIPFYGDRGSGVLDLDSPLLNRFTQQDQLLLEEFVAKVLVG